MRALVHSCNAIEPNPAEPDAPKTVNTHDRGGDEDCRFTYTGKYLTEPEQLPEKHGGLSLISTGIFQKIHYRTTMRAIYTFVIFLLILNFTISPALAEKILGRVVGVHDGDTITVLTTDRQSLRTRLVGIDAPEFDQPYGTPAKQALSGLVFGKDVALDVTGLDRYGRTLARVFYRNLDVNAEMVRLGYAWVYRLYMTDETLLGLELAARAAKRGLWSLSEPKQVPPWEWRRQPHSFR